MVSTPLPKRWHSRLTLVWLVALFLQLAACSNHGPDSPNVIIITLDTFRADRMAHWGGTGLTPTLDGLARQGTVFSHAVVSAGTTLPSHATIFTGLYPRSHAVRSNYSSLPDDVPTLAEQMAKAGYDTGAFVSFNHMLHFGNLKKGFAGLSENGPYLDGKAAAQLALNWLDGRETKRKPVFLWYHNFDPHTPLRLTDYAREKLAGIGYQGPWSDGASESEITSLKKDILRSGRLRQAHQALYDGEVMVADEAVRFFLEALKERGILQNSVLVLVADHGQALGEHGWLGHGAVLWESVIRAPLVIVDYRNPRHRVVETTVGTIDLTPTILQLVGAETLPTQGRSLLPALLGNPLDPADYVVEIKQRTGDSRPDWYDIDRLAIYSDNFKLVRTFGKSRLFDLATDRDAIHPLTIGKTGMTALFEYMEGLGEDYLAQGKTANVPEVDENTIEQLRSLGYVQ